MAAEPSSDEVPTLAALLRQLAGVLVFVLVCATAMGLVLRRPIEAGSGWFVTEFGLAGVFGLIAILDAIPMTVHEPVLLMAYTGGLGFVPIVLASGTASWLSGVLGFFIGRALGQSERMQRLFDRYHIAPFMQRYGLAAVAIAAITPVPYAISTWSAGATGVPLRAVLIGSLLRYLKVASYLGMILLGWSATA